MQCGAATASELNDAPQRQSKDPVLTCVDAMANKVAKRHRAWIEQTGWEKVPIAWAGAPERCISHCYRIQGKELVHQDFEWLRSHIPMGRQ